MNDSILRDAAREATWMQCLVRVDQETIVRGLITNVSTSGAELCCKFQLQNEQTIDVVSPNGSPRRTASIIRVDGNRFGIRWQQPTDAGGLSEAEAP